MGILKLFLGNSPSILEPSNTFTSQVFQHPSNNEPLTIRLLGRLHMQTLLSDPPQRNLQKLFSEALLRQELLKLYKASSSLVKKRTGKSIRQTPHFREQEERAVLLTRASAPLSSGTEESSFAFCQSNGELSFYSRVRAQLQTGRKQPQPAALGVGGLQRFGFFKSGFCVCEGGAGGRQRARSPRVPQTPGRVPAGAAVRAGGAGRAGRLRWERPGG